jgi:asparagine synthase (glutamine-hydrolysing)
MCGIAGSYRLQTADVVQAMITALAHRGPDGSGVDDVGGGTLGHARLAILDVAGGRQPIHLAEYTISFNGEIYNHLDLRRQYLPDRTLRTRTDTEVVLNLYAQLGPRSVGLLDGMFAVAILHHDELFLARDPIGIKPLYYGVQGDTLFFASEIKALSTVTSDIREFPAGHWFHSRLGLHRYYTVGQPFTLPMGAAAPIEDEDQARRLIVETLREAVQKRLMSDVPLGISLSGGLDSSIVSMLARTGTEQLNSFAVGVEDSSDLAAAREVAEFLGTRHHELIYDEDDMLKALPEVLYYLESFDPALVRSAIPNYFLAKLASDHVKVFLTGEGADELYAGYDYLAALDQPEALHAELKYIVAALHNTNLQRADRMSMAHGLEARVPFLDTESIALALALPAEWKLRSEDRPAKALLRQAFEDDLPVNIINRPKEKFSKGAGSSQLIAQRANDTITDTEFAAERDRLAKDWQYTLPNKEALYYYRTLRQSYRDEWIFPSLGRSRSL